MFSIYKLPNITYYPTYYPTFFKIKFFKKIFFTFLISISYKCIVKITFYDLKLFYFGTNLLEIKLALF